MSKFHEGSNKAINLHLHAIISVILFLTIRQFLESRRQYDKNVREFCSVIVSIIFGVHPSVNQFIIGTSKYISISIFCALFGFMLYLSLLTTKSATTKIFPTLIIGTLVVLMLAERLSIPILILFLLFIEEVSIPYSFSHVKCLLSWIIPILAIALHLAMNGRILHQLTQTVEFCYREPAIALPQSEEDQMSMFLQQLLRPYGMSAAFVLGPVDSVSEEGGTFPLIARLKIAAAAAVALSSWIYFCYFLFLKLVFPWSGRPKATRWFLAAPSLACSVLVAVEYVCCGAHSSPHLAGFFICFFLGVSLADGCMAELLPSAARDTIVMALRSLPTDTSRLQLSAPTHRSLSSRIGRAGLQLVCLAFLAKACLGGLDPPSPSPAADLSQ